MRTCCTRHCSKHDALTDASPKWNYEEGTTNCKAALSWKPSRTPRHPAALQVLDEKNSPGSCVRMGRREAWLSGRQGSTNKSFIYLFVQVFAEPPAWAKPCSRCRGQSSELGGKKPVSMELTFQWTRSCPFQVHGMTTVDPTVHSVLLPPVWLSQHKCWKGVNYGMS